MSELLLTFLHPFNNAMRYVARRPKLKQHLRAWIARVPFIYSWLVIRRTRQIRADFLQAWHRQRHHAATYLSTNGCCLSVTPAKSVDEVLQAVRIELKDLSDCSSAG